MAIYKLCHIVHEETHRKKKPELNCEENTTEVLYIVNIFPVTWSLQAEMREAKWMNGKKLKSMHLVSGVCRIVPYYR